jgi:hypothetical protein
MRVYVDIADSGKTITYKEEYGKRQYLYVHDNEGFIFKDLADYAKQVRKEVCEKIKEFLENHKYIVFGDYNHQTLQFDENYICELPEINKFLDQIQGE